MTQMTEDQLQSDNQSAPMDIDPPAQAGPSTLADPPPRVINEHTDLSTLTDAEISQLTLNMKQDSVVERPLVSTPVPIAILRQEYEGGLPNILAKIDWLEANGWDMIWRAKGDGDCFYRAFTLAYLMRILNSESPPLASNICLSNIMAVTPLLAQANFEEGVVDDFQEPLLDALRQLAPEEEGDKLPLELEIVRALQDPETSNCIVVALRMYTAAWMKTHAADFEPFLMHPETFEPLSVKEFVDSEVLPCAKDADEMQITALARCLKQGIRVCYLDGSAVANGEANFVDFEAEEGHGLGDDPIMLLYRIGHYDLLSKDRKPTEAELSRQDIQ